jgi:hypothetical protein
MKKRKINTSSISDAEVITEPKPVVPEPVVAPEPAPVKETPKFKSPLLSEPVDIKEHAMGNPSPSPAPTSFKVDSGFFSNPVVQQPVMTPPPPLDAPEQMFNPLAKNAMPGQGGSSSGGSENVSIPDNIARQGASDLADTIGDIYKRFVPEVGFHFSKINTKEIKKLEASGDLLPGAYSEVTEENKSNRILLENRAKDDMALMKKPLKKLLEVNNVSAPPHLELIGVAIFVVFTYFMMVKGMKNSNDALLEKLYARINRDKRNTHASVVEEPKKQEGDIPLTQTEEVIK